MHGAFGRIRRKSRIIADYADFKGCLRQVFVIKGCCAFFCQNARRIWARMPQIAVDTEDTADAEKKRFVANIYAFFAESRKVRRTRRRRKEAGFG